MKRQARTLTGQEIHSILKLLQNSRDRAIFCLGIYTGLRIGEIICLKVDQVFAGADVRMVLVIDRQKQKTKVHSEIPMLPRLRQVLLEYRQDIVDGQAQDTKPDRPNQVFSGWLFPTKSKLGHLNRSRAHNILSTAFKELRLADVSTHSMRRTMLMSLTKAGVSLRTVREISGHANIGQLQDYLEPRAIDKEKAINALDY